MKTIAVGASKLAVSYLVVVFSIILLPVFLLTTKDVALFESVVNFIFSNDS